jgi:methyl-accepting chemotaxis protein
MFNKLFQKVQLPRFLRIRDWPLAAKLIGAMVMIAVVPLAAVSLVGYANTSRSLRETIGEGVAQSASSAMDEISASLVQEITLLNTVAASEAVQEMLAQRYVSYPASEQDRTSLILRRDEQWPSAPQSSPLVQAIISQDPGVNPVSASMIVLAEFFPRHVEVLLTDKFGANLAATRKTSDYYQADEEWWQAVWNGGAGAFYVGEPEYDEMANFTTVALGVPVRSAQGEVIGVLRTSLNLRGIFDIVSEVEVGETGRAILVDRNGIVIVDPRFEYVGQPLPEGLWARAAESQGWMEAQALTGVQSLVGIAHPAHRVDIPAIEQRGWTMIVYFDRQEALAPVAANNRLALTSTAIAALAAAGLALLVTRGLTGQLNRIMELFGRIGVGEFEARAEVISGDELGSVASSLNAMLDSTLALIQTREERDAMQSAVKKLLGEVKGVALGDLTAEAEVTAGPLGAVADSFNFMIEQLREIIRGVMDATTRVSTAATEIQSTALHLSQGSEAQAAQIGSASAAVDEMALSIQQVSENAALSASVSQQALANAEQGGQAMRDTVGGMQRIREQVQETAKRIKRLGESSQEIGEIVQLIGDIADRTSILALNASIQAAMAGEAGKGFAVVAEEVERLAERSTDATKQIDALIRAIQSETHEAVAAMDATTLEVVQGSEIADKAGQALAEIQIVSARLAELIQSISQASRQQARGSEAISRTMVEIAGVTQQTAAGTKQAAVSISNLASLADQLRASVETFKLPGGNGRGPAAG